MPSTTDGRLIDIFSRTPNIDACEKICEILRHAFNWEESIEGSDFWQAVETRVGNIGNHLFNVGIIGSQMRALDFDRLSDGDNILLGNHSLLNNYSELNRTFIWRESAEGELFWTYIANRLQAFHRLSGQLQGRVSLIGEVMWDDARGWTTQFMSPRELRDSHLRDSIPPSRPPRSGRHVQTPEDEEHTKKLGTKPSWYLKPKK